MSVTLDNADRLFFAAESASVWKHRYAAHVVVLVIHTGEKPDLEVPDAWMEFMKAIAIVVHVDAPGVEEIAISEPRWASISPDLRRKVLGTFLRAHHSIYTTFSNTCTVWSADSDVFPLHSHIFRRKFQMFTHVWTGKIDDLKKRSRRNGQKGLFACIATDSICHSTSQGNTTNHNFFFFAASALEWKRVFPAWQLQTAIINFVKSEFPFPHLSDQSWLARRMAVTKTNITMISRDVRTKGSLYPNAITRGDFNDRLVVFDRKYLSLFLCYHHGPVLRKSLDDGNWNIQSIVLEHILNPSTMDNLEALRLNLLTL